MPVGPREGIKNILVVSVVVCLLCSVVVSFSAVIFKPAQDANKELDRRQNILRAAGILRPDAATDFRGLDANQLFESFEVRAVDLDSGRFTDAVDVSSYDQLRAARQTSESRALSQEEDIATIGRRENIGLAYFKLDEAGTIERLVIPVRGYGLWGTLYGFLAIEQDLSSAAGLSFYTHKETPGLGGEVDNEKWKASWEGIPLYDGAGDPAVQLVKMRSGDASEIDALAGATLTSRGVENLIAFWTGELGYGPMLKRLKTTGEL